MRKSVQNQVRDRLNHMGEIWVKMPKLNYRQSTGVEFRGKYMTPTEYRDYLRLKMQKEDKDA